MFEIIKIKFHVLIFQYSADSKGFKTFINSKGLPIPGINWIFLKLKTFNSILNQYFKYLVMGEILQVFKIYNSVYNSLDWMYNNYTILNKHLMVQMC